MARRGLFSDTYKTHAFLGRGFSLILERANLRDASGEKRRGQAEQRVPAHDRGGRGRPARRLGKRQYSRLGIGETTNNWRTVPTLVLTHGVYFESADERKPASEVSVNLVEGTIEALTPAFTAGEAQVDVEPVFVPESP